MKELVLIRHGESARNAIKQGATYFRDEEHRQPIQGWPDHDIPLTEEGWRQARETGVGLRVELQAPDVIFHSGYRRTIETTNGILEAFTPQERAKIRVRSHLFIRERDAGYGYDMTDAEAKAAFPWLNDYWQMVGKFLARPPGGESIADVTIRVQLFLDLLEREYRHKQVWVVTHGGTIRAFWHLIYNMNYQESVKSRLADAPPNCAVSLYTQWEKGFLKAWANRVFWRDDAVEASCI